MRKHSSFVLAGQRAAAAFIGSSLTCRGGVVVVEEQPALIANTVMQTRIVARRTRRFSLIDIVLPKSFRFTTFAVLIIRLIAAKITH